jgi:hypothetical protein
VITVNAAGLIAAQKKLRKKIFTLLSTLITPMIKLVSVTEQTRNPNLLDAVISGPKGSLLLKDILWIVDREDILETYYWEAWAVTQGAYHCCWSWPGKVTLLPP